MTAFRARRVTVAPGEARPYDAGEWHDALVLLARGVVELEGVSGARRTFRRGAVLHLDAVPLRALRNPGDEPALLIAVSRADPPRRDSKEIPT